MRRIVTITLALYLLSLVGCAQVNPPPSIQPEGGVPQVEEQEGLQVGEYSYNIVAIPSFGTEGGQVYVGPGKIWIGYTEGMEMYPGARAEYPIQIINKTNKDKRFLVYFKPGASFNEGNLIAPADVIQSWVEVTKPNPALPPNSTSEILIALDIPKEIPNDEVHFWYLTQDGISHLISIISEVKSGLEEEYKAKYGDVWQGKYQDEVTQEIVTGRVHAIPSGELLLYLGKVGSVSERFLATDGFLQPELLNNLHQEGYAIRGNLTTDDWGFLIAIKDTGQTGLVQTEGAIKWLVRMR